MTSLSAPAIIGKVCRADRRRDDGYIVEKVAGTIFRPTVREDASAARQSVRVPTDTDTSLLTQHSLVIARAELPDDLLLVEFNSLTNSLGVLSEIARNGSSESVQFANGSMRRFNPPLPEVKKVQYGSEFLVVLGVDGAVAAVGSGIAGAFVGFAKCLDILAAAGIKNEDRLAKRDGRLARRAERKRAIDTLGADFDTKLKQTHRVASSQTQS